MAGASTFNLTFNAAKGNFFDRDKVQKAVDAGTKRVLSKFGAFVRQRARTSIRKRKKPSAPGSPPSSHVGLLRKGILFSYNPDTKSVVIGPALLNGSNGSPTVPELLEYGGGAVRGGKLVRYPARPFMRPAFRAELQGRLADSLKGFVNKGAA